MTTLKDLLRDLSYEVLEKGNSSTSPKHKEEIIEEVVDEFIDLIIKRLIGKE